MPGWKKKSIGEQGDLLIKLCGRLRPIPRCGDEKQRKLSPDNDEHGWIILETGSPWNILTSMELMIRTR